MGAAWRLAQCVLLTIGMNIVLAENEKQAKPVLDRLPAERRAVTRTATVDPISTSQTTRTRTAST